MILLKIVYQCNWIHIEISSLKINVDNVFILLATSNQDVTTFFHLKASRQIKPSHDSYTEVIKLENVTWAVCALQCFIGANCFTFIYNPNTCFGYEYKFLDDSSIENTTDILWHVYAYEGNYVWFSCLKISL